MEIPSMPEDVELFTLQNGLQIILKEAANAPVVSVQAWCRTGSIHEDKWLGAGLSHVLEHMLFKGTRTRTGTEIDHLVQDAGGYMNAYTSFDRTVYWIDVPDTGAAVAVDVLSDIVQNATLPKDELAKELDVIRREMAMGQDDPNRRSSRRLFEEAFTVSPYRFPIIGVPDIFNLLQPEDIELYHRQRYAPNNVFFVVVGKMDSAKIKDQIQEAFADNPARPLPSIYLPSEPAQTTERNVREEDAIELGHMHLSWHTPELRHPDIPALDVLATLLGAGASSRLYREVRQRKALAHQVDAWTYSPGLTGLFGVSAIVDGDKRGPSLEAMLKEIDILKDEAVDESELNKVKKQFTAGYLAKQKSMQGCAHDLGGSFLAAHDLNFSERYLHKIQQTQPEDIVRVARTYLTRDNRTVYSLLPKGASVAAPRTTVTHAHSEVEKHVLENGLRILLKRDARLPFIEFKFAFKGGVLNETLDDNGITSLTSKMLIKGTEKRTAEQISNEVESAGGHIDAYGGNNSFGLSLELLSEDLNYGVDLIQDILFHSAFPESLLEREKQIQLAGIKSLKDQLLQRCSQQMRRALHGNARYGLDAIGREASVSALTQSQIKAYAASLLAPDNCVLAVYGNLETNEVLKRLQNAFGAWTGNARLREIDSDARPAAAGPSFLFDPVNKEQAVVVLGFPGATIFDPDHYALDLAQEASSDLGSRLFVRIRDNLGLAYYVGAQNFTGLAPGHFAYYAGTDPDKVDVVKQELEAEIDILRREGLDDKELQRAKAKMIGHRKIARQDLGSQAMSAALDELMGLGYDHTEKEDAIYESITREQVLEAIRAYLNPERAVWSVVSPKQPSGFNI